MNVRHAVTGLIALALVNSGTTALAGDNGKYVRESVEVANHFIFPNGAEVDGATILIRDFKNRIVRATITSAAMDPDTAYSIWWAVFNYPENCGVPMACALSDLANPSVRASVFWGGGYVSDSNGYANTSFELLPGKTRRQLFANMSDAGLENLEGAEIHVVMRSHGPTGLAGRVADQVRTSDLACPGGVPSGCVNRFASIHTPN